VRVGAGFTLLFVFVFQTALADVYPSKPVRLILPFPPGGGTDILGRLIGAELGARLGQPVVIDNRGGGGGVIGAEAAARATPDGYTLFVGSSSTHGTNSAVHTALPYDPVADFTPISMIATVPSLLVGNPGLAAKDLTSLIALAKAKPDTLSIAIGGIGSSLHLAGEQLKMMADVRLLNVPYKGTAPALTDVLGGQVDLMFISVVTGATQVRAGKLRAYGVTSAQRQPSFPDLPAIGEAVPGFESTAWFGVFAPANLPAEITGKLNAAIVAALANPGMREQLKTEGASPAGNSPADFAAFVRDDVKRWAPIVRQSGARPD